MDFTGYTPPGIYVTDESNPIVTAAGPISALACIVGPGRGYQTDVETVVLTDNDPVTLRQRGIFQGAQAGPPAISGLYVTDTAGNVIDPSDYDLGTVAGNPDTTANNFTTIARSSGSTITSGASVVVYYNYADLSYYTPRLFQDMEEVKAAYGNPLDVTVPSAQTINSPLSMAAQVAIRNGATQLILLATDPADGDFQTQLQNAYAKISTDYRVSVVVPLFVDGYTTDDGDGPYTSNTHTFSSYQSYVNDVKTHVDSAASNGFGHIAIVGATNNLVDDVYGGNHITLASGTADKRVVVAYPNRLNLSVDSGYTIEASGYYLAAAYAGLLTSGAVNRGLTKRIVSGFAGLPTTFIQQSLSTKNSLSASGVAVAEVDRLSRLTVRHGVSSDMSALNYREISLVRIADDLYQRVYIGLEAANLIGEPITLETTSDVKNILTGILEAAINDEVIVEWQNLLVRQQSIPGGDPTVIECKFAYRPAVPLNYINVGFKIDLTTGTVTETAA